MKSCSNDIVQKMLELSTYYIVHRSFVNN